MKLYSLKLDASWRPIEIIDSFKAFGMCRSGRANVVEDYNVKAHGSTMFPAVIVLKSYVRKHEFVLKCNRGNVYNRDKYTCQYCSYVISDKMYVPDPGLKFKLEQLLYDTGELYLDLKVRKLVHYHMLCSSKRKEQREI